MATSFPTSLDTVTPEPAGTDLLGTAIGGRTHSQIISLLLDAVAALEAKVGINSSAVTSSLDYKVAHIASTNPVTSFPAVPAITNIDRALVTGVVGIGSGSPYIFGFTAAANITVGHVNFFVTSTNVSASDCWVALYSLASNGDGTKIAVTADTPAILAGTGLKTLAFTGSVALTAGTSYAVMMNAQGGIGTQLAAAPAVNSNAISSGSIVSPFLQAIQVSGVAPPASFTFASLTKSVTAVAYFELTT